MWMWMRCRFNGPGSDLLKSLIAFARKSVAMAAGKAETAPDSCRRMEATGWRFSLIALASPSPSQ